MSLCDCQCNGLCVIGMTVHVSFILLKKIGEGTYVKQDGFESGDCGCVIPAFGPVARVTALKLVWLCARVKRARTSF
jgi:hypothetical protein